MKTWVIAKNNLDLKIGKTFYKNFIPQGEIGFVKENAHISEENGAIQFPQTVSPFPKDCLEKAKLPNVEEAMDTLLEYEISNEGAGWLAFNFPTNAIIVPTYIARKYSFEKILTHFKKIVYSQVEDFVDKYMDDASLQNDFKWIKSWKYKNDKILLKHESGQYIDTLLDNNSEEYIIDLAMDVQFIDKKVKRFHAGLMEWFQKDEPWDDIKDTI